MNKYSRVFHHISVNDIKRNTEKNKKINEEFLLDIRNARNFLRDLNSPLYSDWKDPNSNLKEEITNGTGGVFYTTFPSTGDTNLENIDGSVSDNYTDAGGNDAFEGTSIRSSGTGEGSDGGFDLGQNYLGFDGEADSRWAILNPIDSSKFDTLVLKAIRGDDNNGGEDPDATGEELRLYYLEPGGSAFRSISINPDGDQMLPPDSDVIIPLSDGTSQGLRNWSVKLPSYARGAGYTYMLFQLTNSGSGFDHFGVTNIKYQRKGPISLFVSLDSPEATSFINDGSGGMTTEQKKKKLEDMLAASEEYIDLLFPENQAAVERAKQNLQRNIDISLDPNTFSFPEYGTPTYNQMYDTKIDADSDTAEIERYLEQQGVTIDDLDSLVDKSKGQFTMGREATLTLLNNQDTQEKALTALGMDISMFTNLTPDTYDKIGKITNLSPGGTPTSGWDGKFYAYGDPALEASQILSLDDYLRVKGTDNYAGIEKPAEAEPGRKYVMEKPYSFSQDSEARPEYRGVRNKDIEERNDRVNYIASVGSDSSVGGHRWDYGIYTGSDEYLAGSKHMLRELTASAANSLNYINQNADFLAYDFLSKYQNGEAKGVYKDLYNQYKDTDLTTNYDPLWVWNSNPKMSDMLTLLRGLSSGRDLDSPSSYYYSGSDAALRAEYDSYHKARNDRLYDNLQKALKLFDSPRSISQYEKDEWYLKNDDTRNVVGVSNTHPYADQQQLSQQQPTQQPTQQQPTQQQPTQQTPGSPDSTDSTKQYPSGPLTIDDFDSVADFSAYKAGGGDAAVNSGKSVTDVINQGKINLNAFDGGSRQPSDPDNQKLSDDINKVQNTKVTDPKKQTPNLLNQIVNLITGADDSILRNIPVVSDLTPPTIEYSTDIATSIIQGKPVNLNRNNLTDRDVNTFLNNSDFSQVQITNTPVPYADENIREKPDGTVEVNPDPSNNNTIRIYDPPTVTVGGKQIPTDFGYSNPIGAAGQAQVQLVVPSNNPRDAYLKYVDHAYYNDKSTDPGETPTSVQGTAADAINSIGPGMEDQGYPSNIKGDRILRFEVPFDQLPTDLKDKIEIETDFRQLGSGSLGKTLGGLGAADAASVSSQNRRRNTQVARINDQPGDSPAQIRWPRNYYPDKKAPPGPGYKPPVKKASNRNTMTAHFKPKGKSLMENYEPKAKHNEKITKHPKMKSPKEFFKRADIKPVYPDTPPPEMINGRHPDLVDGIKVSNRYNRLDPNSAKAMPLTSNPHIDKKIMNARKKPK